LNKFLGLPETTEKTAMIFKTSVNIYQSTEHNMSGNFNFSTTGVKTWNFARLSWYYSSFSNSRWYAQFSLFMEWHERKDGYL